MNSKLSKIRKCAGCGLPLSTDPNNLAYTPNLDFDYCQRCFRLKHYGVDSNQKLSKQITDDFLKEIKIDASDYVVCINDIINIDFETIRRFSNHQKSIWVFNKIDLVTTNHNYQSHVYWLTKLLEDNGVDNPHVILTSTINNFGIRKLIELIDTFDWNDKIYFIGASNSGKSSLINGIIKYTDSHTKLLTTSNFLNTTINIKKIKLHNHIILDTPGFNSAKNILLNLKEYRDILKLFKKKTIRPLSFQIDKDQSFIADSFLYIKTESSRGSITFYSPLDIEINRVKTENLDRNLKNMSCQYKMKKSKRQDTVFALDSNKHYQFYINGFGKLLIKNIIKLTINTFDNVDINKLDYE